MRLFNLQPGEAKPVGLCLSLSFLIGIPRVFTLTAASTLFLEHFSAAELPYAYTASAGVVAVLGVIQIAIQRRANLVRAGVVSLLLLASALFLFRAMAQVPATAMIAAFSLLLWTEVEIALTSTTFWGVANRVFTARQANRVFGLIGAGEIIPSILGGLALPAIVSRVGVADLVLVSAGAHLLAAIHLAVTARILRGRLGAPPAPANVGARRMLLRDVIRNRYFGGIGAILALNVLVFFVIDNAFYHEVRGRLPDSEAFASFLGHFFVALGVGTLAFQIFLSERFRRWMGLQSSLLTTPACVSVLALLVVLAPTFSDSAEMIFWTIVLLKLAERILVTAVANPTYYSLFHPLPPELRASAQGAMETVVARGASLLAGGLLILLNQKLELGPLGLTAAALVALELWLLAGWFVGREYRTVVAGALREQRIEPEALPLRGSKVRETLVQGLSSDRPAHVLYCLRLLDALQHDGLSVLAIGLLGHSHPRVVEAASRRIERSPVSQALAPLRAALADPLEPRVRARVLRALAAVEPSTVESLLQPELTNPEPVVRAGAIVGTLKGGHEALREVARGALRGMAASTEPAAQVAAARAIGSAGDVSLAPVLAALLHATDRRARSAALRSAGRLAQPVLWPGVVAALGEPSVAAVASEVLAQGGQRVLPLLRQVLATGGVPLQRAALDAAGRIGGPKAHHLLLDALEHEDRTVTRAALEALDRSGFVPSPALVRLFRALLDAEVALHAEALGVWRTAGEGRAILREAIEGDLELSTTRILLLLGFVYDRRAIAEARRHLAADDADRRALALELLEAVTSRADAARLLPLVEETDLEVRMERVVVPSSSRTSLEALAQGKARWASEWTVLLARAAIGVAAELDGVGAKDLIQRATALSRVEWLRGLRAEQRAKLARKARLVQSEAGELWMMPGAPADSLLLILSGRLEALSQNGDRLVLVEGETAGGLAVLDPVESQYTLRSLDRSEVLVLGHGELSQVLTSDPEASWRVLVALCRLLRARAGAEVHGAVGVPAASYAPVAQGGVDGQLRGSTLERVLDLKASPVFGHLEDGVLVSLAERVEPVAFAPSETVFRAGDLGTSMYILTDGTCRVVSGERTLAEVRAPSVFGEMAAISLAPRSATVVAISSARALVLERSVIYDLFRAHPEVLAAVRHLLVARLEPRGRDQTYGTSTVDLGIEDTQM